MHQHTCSNLIIIVQKEQAVNVGENIYLPNSQPKKVGFFVAKIRILSGFDGAVLNREKALVEAFHGKGYNV